MGLVKICPVCGEKNPINEWLCTNCTNGDLSGVSPVEESELDDQPGSIANGMKECPSCNEVNPPQARECLNCGWDLTNVSSKEKEEVGDAGSDKRCLVLKLSGGQRIRVKDGDVVGRHGVGRDVLNVHPKTVSKIHARFVHDGGKWYIEDLGSKNGTYINNARIPANTRIEILPGQELSLSKSCKMDIELE